MHGVVLGDAGDRDLHHLVIAVPQGRGCPRQSPASLANFW